MASWRDSLGVTAPQLGQPGYSPAASTQGGFLGGTDPISGALGNVPIIGGLLSPAQANLSPLSAVVNEGVGLERQLGQERQGIQPVGPQYSPGAGYSNFQQQQSAINDLGRAAAGQVASPAELQLRQQAARNAANAYGMSAALQGRSPGMALRQAQQSALQTQGDANQQAAVLRAQEQQAARQAYMNALQGFQGQQQSLRGQDINQYLGVLGGQTSALGAAGGSANAFGQASAANAASQNAMKGGLLGTAGSLLGAL